MAGLLTVAAPAQAWEGFERCQHGQGCLFEHPLGAGAMVIAGNGNVPWWFNDDASSVWNRTGRIMYLYENANYNEYGGRSISFRVYDSYRNIGRYDIGVSSTYFI